MEGETERNVTTEITVNKRCRSSPTLCTPHRAQKRIPLRELANHEASLAPRRLVSSVSATLNPVDNASDSYTTVLIFLNYNMFVSFAYLKEQWSENEVEALAEFVLFYTPGEKWPAHKQSNFWTGASDFIKQKVGTDITRSGTVQFTYCSLLGL